MKRLTLISLAALALQACPQKAVPPEKAAAATPAPAATMQQAPATQPQLPPGHPPISMASAAAPQQPAQAAGMLTGKVVETMNGGGYTYLKLRTSQGDVWAAVQQIKTKVGATVTIAPQMTMDKFESKTLKRTFDQIIFGVAAAPDGPPPVRAAAAPMSSADANAPINVAKAEGANAYTVAEVWAQKDKLKDATVVVRGKVVKFLPGIMGKNWLHLRDGSGNHQSGDDDITVTTGDNAAVGDVVVVTGALRIDKDFGAGYRYAVIVEDAKVAK